MLRRNITESQIDNIYSGDFQIRHRNAEIAEKSSTVTVLINLECSSGPLSKKYLNVKLTSHSDLFFLYSVHISEEDFQCLKSQQGLLVDFNSFPQNLIELLNLVTQNAELSTPKYILEFEIHQNNSALLNVIETNAFKYLTHLSLCLLPGSDADIKRHLAEGLKRTETRLADLEMAKEQQEIALSGDLRQARQALSLRTVELDTFKGEWTAKIAALSEKHGQEISSARDRHMKEMNEFQEQQRQERGRLELAHIQTVKEMESRLQKAEVTNRSLLETKLNHECQLREVSSNLKTSENECQRLSNKLEKLQSTFSGLDTEHVSQQRSFVQLESRLGILQQELTDKDKLLVTTKEMLVQEQLLKHTGEQKCEKLERQISKLELSVKTLSEEVTKGNEIIKKLQGDIKNFYNKAKLRSKVTVEQEKILHEKSHELEEIRRDLKSAKSQIQELMSKNERMESEIGNKDEKIEEQKQVLKTNENVINWLNKQITDAQIPRKNASRQNIYPSPIEHSSFASSRGVLSASARSRGPVLDSRYLETTAQPARPAVLSAKSKSSLASAYFPAPTS